MKKYGVVNYPIKIIDEKIINALADIEVHHEECIPPEDQCNS